MFRLITCSVVAIALVFLLSARADGGLIYPSQLPSASAREWTSSMPIRGAIEAHRLGLHPLDGDMTHAEPSKPNTFDMRFWASDENWLEVPMSMNEGKALIDTLIGGPAQRVDSGFTTQSLMPTYDPAFIVPTGKEVGAWTTRILPSELGQMSWSSTWPDARALSAPPSRVTSLLPDDAWSKPIEIGPNGAESSWPDRPVSITPGAQMPGEMYVSAQTSLSFPMREAPDPLRNDSLPHHAMPTSSGTEVLERSLTRAGREWISNTGGVKSGRARPNQAS